MNTEENYLENGGKILFRISGIPTGSRPTPCRASHLHRDQVDHWQTSMFLTIATNKNHQRGSVADPRGVPRLCSRVHLGRLLPRANHRGRPAGRQLHLTGDQRPSGSCRTTTTTTRSCPMTGSESLGTIFTTGGCQPSLWATGSPRMGETSSSLFDLSQGSSG